jgi:hypothetical protein
MNQKFTFTNWKKGHKILVIRNYGGKNNHGWYKKDEILTIKSIDKRLIIFKEYPDGAFNLEPNVVWSSSKDFFNITLSTKLSKALYG